MELYLSVGILLALVACYEIKIAPKEEAEKAVYKAAARNAKALLANADKLKRRRPCGDGSKIS